MADNLPYMVSPSNIPKILGKIGEARRPERFTQDFLETKLGFSGGSARPVIPLLKRIGFLSSDGTPTRLYDQFRNPSTSGRAMAEAIRAGYKELYDRNEYAHDLTREKLKDLIVEMTGVERDNRAAEAIVGTFNALKELADFDAPAAPELTVPPPPTAKPAGSELAHSEGATPGRSSHTSEAGKNFGLNVAYTINLNLPETTNPDVFNAIFRALKDNLLES